MKEVNIENSTKKKMKIGINEIRMRLKMKMRMIPKNPDHAAAVVLPEVLPAVELSRALLSWGRNILDNSMISHPSPFTSAHK